MTKTPYTSQIDAAWQLLEAVKDSELQKKGTKDFADGTAKAFILPRHIDNIKRLSEKQCEMETIIGQNLDLVAARAEDMELSSNQFFSGEDAYQRLSKAKELDSLVAMSNSAQSDSKIVLNKEMYEMYLREILEKGGAPSIQELSQKADQLGGYGYQEEGLAKHTFNLWIDLFNSIVGDEYKTNTKLEMNPMKESLVNS